MTDPNYLEDLGLLANTLAKAKSQMHSLEKAAGGICLDKNKNKIEFICFKHERAITTLSSKPLKLVDQFPYLGSNILSTESGINIHLAKAWTVIDRSSI